METNQSGQILGAYTNGLMGPISKRSASNQYGYLMNDALGTVRNIVDANKDIEMTYKYDIFGAIREAIGQDPIGIPQTFTGKELDTDSGLHYFGARYYDSSLGRFITADSWTWGPDDERALIIGLTAQLILERSGAISSTLATNYYVYCANRPTVLVDPSGRTSMDPTLGWFVNAVLLMVGALVPLSFPGVVIGFVGCVASYFSWIQTNNYISYLLGEGLITQHKAEELRELAKSLLWMNLLFNALGVFLGGTGHFASFMLMYLLVMTCITMGCFADAIACGGPATGRP
jgi:RHS repeat-associated protein